MPSSSFNEDHCSTSWLIKDNDEVTSEGLKPEALRTDHSSSYTGGTSFADGAMSLLDKYAKISSVIDETRKQNDEVKSKIRQCLEQIEYLSNRTKQYKQEVAATTDGNIPEKLKVFKNDMEFLNNEHQQLEQSKERLQKVLHGLSTYVQQANDDFVARCVEFRRDWKRARVTILLQEEQIRQQQMQQVEPTLFALEGGIDSEKSLFRRCFEKNVQKRQKKQHPINSDVEISTAERLFQSLSSDLTSKQSLYEKKLVEKGKAMESSRDRAHRLEQGKEQLKRIQQDTNLIQHELIEVQEQITVVSTNSIREQKSTDATSVGHIMRPIDQTPAQVARPSNAVGSSLNYYTYNHATNESSSFVTPSPWAAAQKTGTPHYSVIQGQNQAFQRSSTQRQQQKNNSNAWNRNPYAPKKAKTKKTGATSPLASAQPKQHAHKAGKSKARIYNRQFTTTLQLDTNCAEDITLSTSTDFFETAGKVGSLENSERTMTTSTTPNPSVNTNATSEKKLLIRDEDEDEGSDLLSYIAFGNE
jgi:hypothetical protein